SDHVAGHAFHPPGVTQLDAAHLGLTSKMRRSKGITSREDSGERGIILPPTGLGGLPPAPAPQGQSAREIASRRGARLEKQPVGETGLGSFDRQPRSGCRDRPWSATPISHCDKAVATLAKS